ncbi:MAG: hypothetical protein QS721_00175 [Candidatus Endonucleobacter sp. (ex Gigantidas childressi)]|nr:hypothetical protein [Candidatus Endonucleobacter sp. (ex Gigantidas childressi)]
MISNTQSKIQLPVLTQVKCQVENDPINFFCGKAVKRTHDMSQEQASDIKAQALHNQMKELQTQAPTLFHNITPRKYALFTEKNKELVQRDHMTYLVENMLSPKQPKVIFSDPGFQPLQDRRMHDIAEHSAAKKPHLNPEFNNLRRKEQETAPDVPKPVLRSPQKRHADTTIVDTNDICKKLKLTMHLDNPNSVETSEKQSSRKIKTPHRSMLSTVDQSLRVNSDSLCAFGGTFAAWKALPAAGSQSISGKNFIAHNTQSKTINKKNLEQQAKEVAAYNSQQNKPRKGPRPAGTDFIALNKQQAKNTIRRETKNTPPPFSS